MIDKLRQAIISVLKALELDDGLKFVEVTDIITENFLGYPSAEVIFLDSEGEIYTTTLNKRTYNFNINVWQGYTTRDDADQSSQSDAQIIVDKLTDQVINDIEHSTELNNLISIMNPVNANDKQILTSGEGSAVLQEIEVSMVLLE